MTRDELEFSISQYLDGTLPPAELDALETRLGSDAEARALYAEYESLQGMLKTAPAAIPAVRWDRFAEQISAAVARQEAPAQSYELRRWFRPARLAVAASMLVAGAIGFSLINRGGDPGAGTAGVQKEPTAPVRPIEIVVVDAPARDGAAADPVPVVNFAPVTVAVGPASDGEAPVRLYAEGVVTRRSRAVIVGATPVAQDGGVTPY